jgi:2-polyprenyl-3-methyl-5-hydroxy-6-metoxy-1,4-benzoquinol methylase
MKLSIVVRNRSLSMPHCPFCNSESNRKIDEIAQSVVISYYQKSLGIDASKLLDANGTPISLLQCQSCDVKWYSPSPCGDGAFYEGLQQHSWYYQDEKPEYYFAQKWLIGGTHLLEIGCGKGAFSKFIGSDVSYRGLEFNEEAVKKGREAGLRIDIEAVETHAAENPESYDVVCNFQVLEHVSKPLTFLEACAASLKQEGLLIVAVPSEDSFLSITEGGFLNMPPHHLTRWSDKSLTTALAKVGITTLETWHEPVADYHRDWYSSVMAKHAVRRMLGQANPLYSRDTLSRITNRLLGAKVIREYLKNNGERHFAYRGRGHTVCIVGRKTGISA